MIIFTHKHVGFAHWVRPTTANRENYQHVLKEYRAFGQGKIIINKAAHHPVQKIRVAPIPASALLSARKSCVSKQAVQAVQEDAL